jgi:hypothetical protein
VFPYAKQRENEGSVIVIDLEGQHGAVLANAGTGTHSSSVRFGYPAKLATSVRGRLKRLANGSTPAELQLGDDVSAEAATALLKQLEARWHHPPTAAAQAVDGDEISAGGTEAGLPCRRPFVQPAGSAGPRHRSDPLPADSGRHLGL